MRKLLINMLSYCFAVNKSSKDFLHQKKYYETFQWLVVPFLNKEYEKYAQQTTQEVLKSISDNDELKAVLAAII